MIYEPLHHKYRPKNFKELVGQQAIATTLINALQEKKIAPAYLFTGSRGTGKTSSARILAKSLNCLSSNHPVTIPCETCMVCTEIAKGVSLDIIEIDAASNTGVDNIRDLIEKAQFAPVQCRYKVYIIDEVHMLSTAAFNALLKTLEEPPNKVVFILATTDPQRVLPTIISRCQRFDFRRIPLEDIVAHLQIIAQQESINITTEAIRLVAQIAQGGLRDAESLLDQLSLLSGQITIDKVWDLVGTIPERELILLLQAISSNDPITILEQSRQLMEKGREPLIVLQQLASYYRDLLIAKTAPDRPELVTLTPPTWQQLIAIAKNWETTKILAGQKHLKDSELQIKNTTQPRLWLEVTLMGLLYQPTPQIIYQPNPSPSPQPTNLHQPEPTTLPKTPQPTTPPVVAPHIEPIKPVTTSPPPPKVIDDHDDELTKIWKQVTNEISLPSVKSLLQHCRLLTITESSANINIASESLLKIANQTVGKTKISKISILESAFLKICGRPIKVNLQVNQNSHPTTPTLDQPPPTPPSTPPSTPLSNQPTIPEPPPPSPTIPEPPPPTTQPESDLTQAARKLAKLFEGKRLQDTELVPSSQSDFITSDYSQIDELEETDYRESWV